MMYEDEINTIVKRIAKECNPKAIIVFGSVASDTCNDESDIDMMVILDTEMTYYERTLAIRRSIGITSTPLDILVFTPEEIEEGKQKRGSVVYEALNKGKVVYGAT